MHNIRRIQYKWILTLVPFIYLYQRHNQLEYIAENRILDSTKIYVPYQRKWYMVTPITFKLYKHSTVIVVSEFVFSFQCSYFLWNSKGAINWYYPSSIPLIILRYKVIWIIFVQLCFLFRSNDFKQTMFFSVVSSW